ncbi:MAG TPA: serpin family protein, partial [Ktedonobacteraceae bacterium]|nr:serpin family protein [Ktedonobacteraceae bacterium]
MLDIQFTRKALTEAIASQTNQVFSPLSAYLLAAMLYYASDEATQRDWKKPGDFSDTLITGSWNLPLRIHNSVWYQQHELTPSTQYENTLLQLFHTSPEAMNFADCEAAADIINQRIAKATDGLVINPISPSDLFNAIAVFLNALLLEAKWAKPFHEINTSEGTFYGSSEVTARFMYQEGTFGYIDNGRCQSILLPLEEAGRSIQIVLPQEGVSLADVVQQDGLHYEHTLESVQLFLPRIDVLGDVNCGALLGVSSTSLAAFGVNGPRPVVIKQASRALWDEKGVKMAAATY